MKSFSQFVNESIIDIPRRTYAKDVFDNVDTDNPKIKPKIIGLIMKQFTEFKKEYPILKYSLIGSILTKRYRNDADLDINVLFDVPAEKAEEERVRLSKKYLSASNPDNIQGKLIPGTKHPINYYFITDKKTYDEQEAKADAVFDIGKNKFIKRPDKFVFDSELYIKEFERKVQALDVVKGELTRDIIDYEELKELKPDDVLNLQDKINDKLEEIEKDLQSIIKIGDGVDAERRAAFDRDMTPDEIRQYGIKNRLPKNVIYKMLEKYHYLTFYKKCKKILDDGVVTDKEIDSLKEDFLDDIINGDLSNILHKTKNATHRLFKDFVAKVKRMATTKQRYEYAAKLVQSVIDRKKREAGNSGLRHDIGYYAAVIGNQFHDIDTKKLVTMIHEEYLQEEKSIAFTFGRFNPPTIGHEKLIDKVKSIRADDYKIYLSRSEDSKRNPLTPNEKLRVMKQMFPSHANKIEINPSNMILDIATKLYNKGYKDITMVVGSDRVREFESILKRYNDVKSRHGYYNFKKINVVSAGERDPDAEGAVGMSASKMRDAASKGDIKSFSRGVPSTYRDVPGLMRLVRRGMNLAASFGGMMSVDGSKPIVSLEEFEQQQIRDLYVREMIFNVGDKAKYVKEDIQGIVKRRGTNYIVIEDNNNNLYKAWIWDCLPDPADREIQLREMDLNVDYGFEAVSEIKEDKSILSFKDFSKDLNMNDKKEAYDIGHDYAQHTIKMTPGQPGYDSKYSGGEYKPSTPEDNNKRVQTDVKKGIIDRESVNEKDIKEWSLSESTIDKYRERYKEQWRAKLDEVVRKMMEKIDVKF